MKKFAIYFILVLSSVVILSLPMVWGEDDDSFSEQRFQSGSVGATGYEQYKTECGECHMAYPPGLLPARSWTRVMQTLDDHYSDNAELEPELTQDIKQYLVARSADNSGSYRSNKWTKSIQKNAIPLRISELSYFVREHDDLGKRMVADNPDVLSFSNCNACHRKAEQGSFRERDINIPNYGEWDD